MSLAVDETPFFLGVTAPQEKHDIFSLLIDGADNVVCKVLPPLTLMGGGFMLFDG